MALLYLGLMSGTSLDGIDAALVEADESDDSPRFDLRSFRTSPYDADQRGAIEQVIASQGSGTFARDLARLNRELGVWFADAALAALGESGTAASEVALIGSHGHTVWHEPPSAANPGASLQVGDPAIIAERVGVPVVSNFRARDIAAGGHGAPLVPIVDAMLFTHPNKARALQNIGGIANVTFLASRSNDASASHVVAFDTGPGVGVIDAVVQIVSRGSSNFDEDGRRAAAAEANEDLLGRLLADPYFAAGPPKSTGRERYGVEYARRLVRQGRELGIERDDVLVATATALTACSIADAYERFAPSHAQPVECFVSGGGARNPTLMGMLAEALAPISVDNLSALGWNPDAKEAAAFAILAYLFRCGRPGNLPSVTGASGPRILGVLTPV